MPEEVDEDNKAQGAGAGGDDDGTAVRGPSLLPKDPQQKRGSRVECAGMLLLAADIAALALAHRVGWAPFPEVVEQNAEEEENDSRPMQVDSVHAQMKRTRVVIGYNRKKLPLSLAKAGLRPQDIGAMTVQLSEHSALLKQQGDDLQKRITDLHTAERRGAAVL